MLSVEQLESRDCPSGPPDLYVIRYRGMADAQLRQREQEVVSRAAALAAEGQTTQHRTGVLEYAYDLLRAPDRFMRLQDAQREMAAIQRVRMERGR